MKNLDYIDQFIVVLIAAVGLALAVIVAGEARRMWKTKKQTKAVDPCTDNPKGMN